MSGIAETLAAIFARPIAHRGLHARSEGRIENTRAAFAAAMDAGYGIECDLQVSLDGVPMVFHDRTLERLTSARGALADLPARTLATLAVDGGSDRIEPFSALLAQVAGRVPLVVEIKSRFDRTDAILPGVLAAIEGYAGPLVLKSFDAFLIARLRAMGARVPLGIIGQRNYDHAEYGALDSEGKRRLAECLHFPETRPDFLSWHHRDLDTAPPVLLRAAAGLPVMTWTIRSPTEAEAVRPRADQFVFVGVRPA